MPTLSRIVPPLLAGDHLSRQEFLRRWETMPELKRAELIGGVVYVPSPLSPDHAGSDNDISTWLGVYKAATPGCEAGNNCSWLMIDDAPQPDTSLWIRPEYGGRVKLQGRLMSGAPEFVAEVCLTSAAYDLHDKLDLYQRAGVQEYLVVLIHEREVRWHRLVGGTFQRLSQPADGVLRSSAFPGLWLDAPALLARDLGRVLALLQQGTGSPEHQAFVDQLAARKKARRGRKR